MRFLLLLLISWRAFGQTSADWAKLDAIFLRMYADLKTGFAVEMHRDGVPIYSRVFGGFDRDRPVPIASASEWLSGAVLLRAVDGGRLTLDDTVEQHLPYFTGASGKATGVIAIFHDSEKVMPYYFEAKKVMQEFLPPAHY